MRTEDEFILKEIKKLDKRISHRIAEEREISLPNDRYVKHLKKIRNMMIDLEAEYEIFIRREEHS